MKQRRTRPEPYDSTEHNQRELERYRTMSMKKLQELQQFWIDRTVDNRVGLSAEILALVNLAIAERIGRKSS